MCDKEIVSSTSKIYKYLTAHFPNVNKLNTSVQYDEPEGPGMRPEHIGGICLAEMLEILP